MSASSEEWRERAKGTFVELLGIDIVERAPGAVRGRLAVRPHHLAPNGYLHAAAVVALADTCAGAGSMATLPDGAVGFTTIELKSNFVGTARDGVVECEGRLVHGGRTTQVWDVDVRDEGGSTIAVFRCTQLLLYPR